METEVERRMERVEFIGAVIRARVVIQYDMEMLALDKALKEEVKKFIDQQTQALLTHGMREGE